MQTFTVKNTLARTAKIYSADDPAVPQELFTASAKEKRPLSVATPSALSSAPLLSQV